MRLTTDPNQDVLLQAGFRPPVDWMFKPDPRGSEYGNFGAYVQDSGKVLVRKLAPESKVDVVEEGGKKHVEVEYEPVEFAIEFPTAKDFLAWAKAYC